MASFNITEANVSMSMWPEKYFKSFAIFNISDKSTIKSSHKKVAKILINDPNVLAVEFLQNQVEYGMKASIKEMNKHKRKVKKQDPDYDHDLVIAQIRALESEQNAKNRLEEAERKD